MGLHWLTGNARIFNYNVGALDVWIQSRKLYKQVVEKGLKPDNPKVLNTFKWLDRLGVSFDDALKTGSFKNFDIALENKLASNVLNEAGWLYSNRDAIIPQVSNRLLFTMSRNPYLRLVGQFMSWAMGKSAQTHKMLQRIENGDIRTFVKLLAAVPVYAGVQQLREIVKWGEATQSAKYNYRDWLAHGLRLSGLGGWLSEGVIGKFEGPGKREWYLPGIQWGKNAIQSLIGIVSAKDKEKSIDLFNKKVAPLPNWIRRIREWFTQKDIIEFDTLSNEKLMKEDKKFSKGGRVGYEHGDEVILPQEKPIFQTDAQASEGNPGNKELGSPVKKIEDKDMNKKDMAAILAAGSIAAGATVFDKDIKKAVDNGLLPAKKPIVIVEKNYNNISDLDPEKKEWLFNTAEKVYLTNKNNVIPNDIILAINGGETGWGTSRFWKEGSNNLFNFQSFNDKEESIAAQNSNAKIKKFKTAEDSIKQFLDWIENKDSYASVREEIKLYNEGEGSKERIIDAIAKTGFAEDKKWSGKIKSILNNRIDGKHKKELQKLATILFTNPGNKN